MKPTRISTLVVVAVICAALGWLLLRAVYTRLPPLPWTGVPALLIAALAEAWTGRDLKARIAARRGSGSGQPRRGSGSGQPRRGSGSGQQGRGTGSGQGTRRGLKPVAPLFVSRMVALAKASSLAAAVIAGFAAGFDVYLSGSLGASTPRQDALTAAVTFAAAVVLACAALYLEYCCRVPGDQDQDERDAAASSG